MEKLIVLDGNSLINRAFYAIPLLSNQQGVFTNAVYGFTNMLFRIVEDHKPCHLAVAFDKTKAHLRIAEYAEYKANRKGTPDELRPQFDLTREILRALDVPILELEGYEADDLIGTLVKRAEGRNWKSIIYTGDKDALQLISPLVTVALTKKGISELELVDVEALRQKYALTPPQITDLKGLMGDSSDNIPGVPGIGEKTALKLLAEFGSVENIYENIGLVGAKKLQEKLIAYREQAYLSKRLATIVTDAPMELDLGSCALSEPDYPQLLEIFKRLEFKNLIRNISEKINQRPGLSHSIPSGFAEPREIREGTGAAGLKDLLNSLQEPIGLYLEYEGDNVRHGGISAIGLAGSNRVCGFVTGEALWDEGVWQELAGFIRGPKLKAVHDYKQVYSFLSSRGIEPFGIEMDLMLAAYLINPLGGKYGLEDIAFEQLNLILGSEQGYGVRASVIQQLALIFKGKLAEMELWPLFKDIELPLAKVLAKMELTGVKVDRAILDQMGIKLTERIAILEDEIVGLAGEKFNVNSPQQLGIILFEKLKLPVLKKTKTGYSTSAEVLEELAPSHPIIEKILEYRQLSKLNSTYIEGLKNLQDPETGKVHTTFNQTITATGRLSSTEPNLQNIPVRLELGRQIRKAFGPSEEEMVILAADYSQIELRVLAHISGDANLQAAFRQGEDIHTRTASEIFGVEVEEVTSEMRRRAKAVNFGIVYGIGDFSLSRDIGVTRKEAREYIDNYFARYPKVKSWIEEVIREAREKGFVTTVYGRRRNLPDLFSSNKVVRSFGERTAMNTPIQGSAADVIKLAMVKLDQKLGSFRTRILLQVHDELIFEVPKEELEEILQLVPRVMEEAIPMAVRLKVDLKAGPNWYDLQKLRL